MFSKYFSEVVSLLAEAVLGSPKLARAQCFERWRRMCDCGCCGADKAVWGIDSCCFYNGSWHCTWLGERCATC